MASLRFREKNVLEEFLEMGGGYVLNFSDRTFAAFFGDFEIDIDSEPYMSGHSGSKAKRLRSFWDKEMIRCAESYRADHPLKNEAQAVVSRLRAGATPPVPRPTPAPEKRPPIRARPIEIFFSYAHEDEELMNAVRRQLVVRERLGEIVKWHDRMIPAGDEWRNQIDHRIQQAHVILLFMSPHFLESRYCYEIEGDIALRRHRNGDARVIPVVLRTCDWTATPFGEIQGLPRDGVPINQWPDMDQASLDVARGTMRAISQ